MIQHSDSSAVRKKLYVGEVAGRYGELFARLLSGDRVFPSRDVAYRSNYPGFWSKNVIGPQRFQDGTVPTQMFNCTLDIYAPGAFQPRHAHMNSVVLYVLEGEGYDIQDGKRVDWQAGDVITLKPGSVQQHFNSGDGFVRMLTIKCKPLYMFANLIYQTMFPLEQANLAIDLGAVDTAQVDPYESAKEGVTR